MSKRKAEDILCYRPRKRFVSLFVDSKSVRPALRRDSSDKRKLQADGETEQLQEPACKRLESAQRGAEPGDRRARRTEPGDQSASRAEPGDRSANRAEPGDRSASCGGDWARGLGVGEPWAIRTTTGNSCSSLTDSAQNAPLDEVSCQYNSFQFWRVPLPIVELAEIEDFGQLKIAEEMNYEDPEEAAEIEMELQN
ncbi:protein AF1q [Cetorhinus maximus]